MSGFRAAGMNYIQVSNICAKLLRRALKPNLKTEALKRDESVVRFTPWKDGKAIKDEIRKPSSSST